VRTSVIAAVGVCFVAAVAGLGAWGYGDRHESRARHERAVEAENRGEVCDQLSVGISALTGQPTGTGLPPGIAYAPLSDQELVASASYLSFFFPEQLEPVAPPVLEEPVDILTDASNESLATGSAEPYRSEDAVRAAAALAEYYGEQCP
jgi:hypothetical protein